MNKAWITLVAIGVVGVIILVGWDFFLTVTGNKSEFAYNIVPMDTYLYSNLEKHLTTDPNYYIYDQQVNSAGSNSDTNSTSGTTDATTNP